MDGNGRTLIYTICDRKYASFIPMFVLSNLIFEKDIDIEIGVDFLKLENSEIEILTKIQNEFPNSRIHIVGGVFEMVKNNRAKFHGQEMFVNTVRFVVTPQIQDEYVYISDVDIFITEPFVQQHINDMNEHMSNYSNIVRQNSDVKRMTGLHFTRWDAYYPLNVDLSKLRGKNDENVLYDIVKEKNYIDESRTFRPVHGIHASPCRPYILGNGKIPGWGVKNKKEGWNKIKSHPLYNDVYNASSDLVKQKIDEINKYYLTND